MHYETETDKYVQNPKGWIFCFKISMIKSDAIIILSKLKTEKECIPPGAYAKDFDRWLEEAYFNEESHRIIKALHTIIYSNNLCAGTFCYRNYKLYI